MVMGDDVVKGGADLTDAMDNIPKSSGWIE